MKLLTGLALGMALVISGCTGTETMASSSKKSHAHMDHVSKARKGTPDGKGYLPTAIAEAKIAAQHAGFAANKTGDLDWMKKHTRHVLNAIDPSVVAKGPGMGYGVIKAASGSVKHINLAAKSMDASDNIRTHAVHVAASSQNTVSRANQIVALGQKVLAATSAGEAAPSVTMIAALSSQLLTGVDANGDGSISWHEGEGGLNAANKHMGIMVNGEGM